MILVSILYPNNPRARVGAIRCNGPSSSLVAEAIQGDIPNYTDITPVIQIGALLHGELKSR